MTEAAIDKAIGRLLRERGAWAVKTHGTVQGRRGVPDWIAVYRGYTLALETKQPGRYPTPLQHHELDQAQRAGAFSGVVHSADEVRETLDYIDRRIDKLRQAARPHGGAAA